MTVSFVQRSSTVGEVTDGATLSAHNLGSVDDVQVVGIATHASVTPTTPSGWTLLNRYTTAESSISLYWRTLTSGNLASNVVLSWASLGSAEMRTYAGAETVVIKGNGTGLTSPSRAVDELLVRFVAAAEDNDASFPPDKSIASDGALLNARGSYNFTWYGGITAGDDPTAAGGTAPTRTATQSPERFPQWVDVDFTPEVIPPDVTLAGVRQARVASFGLLVPVEGLLAAVRQQRTAAFVVDVPLGTVLAGSRQQRTAAFALDKPPATSTANMLGGRVRGGSGIITTEPVVDPGPTGAAIHRYEVAIAQQALTTTDGVPSLTIETAEAKKALHRVVVGGKDVTWFRGVHTPTPAYRLIDPLLYGAGTLRLPQVSPAFERLGTGKLKWLRKGAKVVVQRVDPDTLDVIATDYIGFISAFNIEGNDLTCDLGGQVSGRLALRWQPQPVFQLRRDAGALLYHALRMGRVHLRGAAPFTNSNNGPDTGIPVMDLGGMDAVDYVNELVALTATADGDQNTITRTDDGQWVLTAKDTTTRDATVYFDDARMVASLKRDLAEEPNRIFATGVTPNFERVTFRRYPGLTEARPAAYPFDNTAITFGVGTTNDDCDHPDDRPILILGERLIQAGYLEYGDADDTYTAAYGRAVKALRRDIDETVTTTMNYEVWKALWDIDRIGFSLRARTFPAAWSPSVHTFRFNAAGAVIGINPSFDPKGIGVDHQIDVGSGFSKERIRDFAKSQIVTSSQWVGTVRCNTALIRGEHTPGDPITAADVMPIHEIRPGMNVWAPRFDGGTLFHVSGVEVDADGEGGSLVLDTRARPTMAAWEVIRQSRESRKNPARVWLNQYRSSKQSHDMNVWDDIGGQVRRTRLPGGQWSIIPVLAGQEGTVSSLRMALSPNREFAVAVFGKRIGERRLNHLVPNPLSAAGSKKWEKESTRNKLDRHILLYAAGSDSAPCGYWPKQKNGDSNPITGKWYDDAGFSYRTFQEPVLYLAVYVPNDTFLEGGRLFRQQLEAGL